MHKEREKFLIAFQYLGNTQKVGQTWKIVEQNEVYPWASVLPPTVFSVVQKEPGLLTLTPVHLKLLPPNKIVCTFQNGREAWLYSS